ncbi:MAG: cation:proton antiporter [Planctomycetaceae bacterium]|nr:cation:proton antiporter [Planctomycetaceae bacterium]
MLAETNILLVLAVILVAGVISASLAKLASLPSVTGQILIGVLLGPSVLHVFAEEDFHALKPILDFALGLMAVAVGSHLNYRKLAVARRRLLLLVAMEATFTPVLVFCGLHLGAALDWPVSLLIATICVSTAPATVLAIVKETASRGAFVTTLIAAVALNNLACIILFELARTLALQAMTPDSSLSVSNLLGPMGLVAMSVAMGVVIGFVLIGLTRRTVRPDRLSVLSLIAILLTAGLSEWLELSVLLACLSLGITLANVTPDKDEIGHGVFESFESAIFAVFFTVAGMELRFDTLAIGGLLAVLAFAGRAIGKILAGQVSMRLAGTPARFRNWLGMALVPQAGLAVGLMLLITDDVTFAPIREVVLAVILAMVLLNETIGPLLTRFGLKKSGDFGRDRARVLDFLSEHNITTDLSGDGKEAAITQLIRLAKSTHNLPHDEQTIFEAVMEGEAAACTCVGNGLALPHARIDVGETIVGAMGISRFGIPIKTPDGQPVHCMVLILTPTDMPERHLEVLKALASSIGRDGAIQQQLYHVDSPAHADELIHLDEHSEGWNYYLDSGEPNGD